MTTTLSVSQLTSNDPSATCSTAADLNTPTGTHREVVDLYSPILFLMHFCAPIVFSTSNLIIDYYLTFKIAFHQSWLLSVECFTCADSLPAHILMDSSPRAMRCNRARSTGKHNKLVLFKGTTNMIWSAGSSNKCDPICFAKFSSIFIFSSDPHGKWLHGGGIRSRIAESRSIFAVQIP